MGRGPELRALDELLDAVASGAQGCAIVHGEPGIGKTRLLVELRRRSHQRGFLDLSGRAAEFESGLPFEIFIDALESHLTSIGSAVIGRLDPDSHDEIAHMLPWMTAVQAGVASPSVERYRLHRAVRSLLEELAEGRPIMLSLDDLHWADEASIELVTHLLYRPPQAPVLIVLAYRDGRLPRPLQAAIGRAAREQRIRSIPLGPLTPEEADQMLGARRSPAERSDLYRQAGGNPFYLEQLLRPKARTLRPALVGRRHSALEVESVPGAVMEAITDELFALSRPARLVLRGAAAAWEPFDLDLAAHAADVERSLAVKAVDEALELDLIRDAEATAAYALYQPGRRFCFRHPIVRRAIYEQMDHDWRVAAHARVARAFAAREVPASLQAHHIEQFASTGDAAAVAVLAQAADAALARAPAAAARWLGVSLRLLADDVNADRRLALMVPLATALAVTGHIADSRTVVDEALRLIPSSQPDRRAELLAALGRVEHITDGFRRGRGRLKQGLRTAGDAREQAVLWISLSSSHGLSAEWDAMETAAGRSLEHAESIADPVLTALALAQLALAELALGRISGHVTDTVSEQITRAAALVDSSSDDALGAHAEVLVSLGVAEIWLGHATAKRHLSRALRIVRATEQQLFYVPVVVALGLAELCWGDVIAAGERLAEALDASALLGDERLSRCMRMIALLLQCLHLRAVGDLPSALDAAEEAVALCDALGSELAQPLAHALVGITLIDLGGHRAGCARILTHAGGPDLPLVPAGLRPLLLAAVARSAIALDELERAAESISAAERNAACVGLPVQAAEAGLARAELLLATGDPVRAAELATWAATQYREVEQPIGLARADLLVGRALAAMGAPGRAAARLRRARAVLAGSEDGRLSEEVADQLAALDEGALDGGGARMASGGLSARERDVARLVALGRTNKEVAQELFITVKTVESHVARIFAKLRVNSRVDVARALGSSQPEIAAALETSSVA